MHLQLSGYTTMVPREAPLNGRDQAIYISFSREADCMTIVGSPFEKLDAIEKVPHFLFFWFVVHCNRWA